MALGLDNVFEAGMKRKRGQKMASVALLPFSFLLSSCLGTGYTFVDHVTSAGESTFFKIPQSWSLFHDKAIIQDELSSATPQNISQIEQTNWANIFMGKPNAKLTKALGFESPVVVGLVRAEELSPSARDTFSLASLRTLVLQVDPLAGTPPTGLSYKVLSYNEFVRPGGFRGSQLSVDIQIGKTKSTFTQEAVVDAQTNWVYLIAMGCSVSCFKSNQPEIQSVMNSWNVKVVK
ncbi:hypothetical protein SAMN02745225_02104 [Ferrithrix thermotolerans DSM 19514]|uniref:Uncharacterized protein n=1 Tax=Ferrithrix thermotolerans DSM 19514 TaxID=1121881 RepID=A0A1M4XQD1_9ACTN|nr:hypothetical protein [Ferrithrix thermotolerans]SHE95797.1 hypothetical protein SAMN02745225_02104 [Ferrithrix thermotolerans DSM 19514]